MNEHLRPRLLFVGPMLGRYAGWVPNPAEIIAGHIAKRGFSCLLTSSVMNRYLRLADIMISMIRWRRDYDLLCFQVYSGQAFVVNDLASALGQRLGKPMIMVLHGGGLPKFMVRYPVWTNRVLKRACRIVSPSKYLAEAASKEGFAPRVIPHGIEISSYPYRHRDRVDAKLLWMRTFHHIYNPQMAVEALAKVSETIPDAVLTFAGQDKGELDNTRALGEHLGVNEKIRYVGFLDSAAKQREFNNHDIYLNTNWVDNHPISVNEAAAFGLPVIATAVGGMPYMIQDNKNGILVPAGDSEAMANAVLQLLENPHLTSLLSTTGRGLAEQADWSNVLPQWEKLFIEAAQS